MKTVWLKKNNKNKLILFFNGWGMDENPFFKLVANNFDVLMACDYRSLEFDKQLIKEYDEVIIIAWSFGVWAANSFEMSNITKRIAINGTALPIDNKFGIPSKVFDFTLKTMNEKSRIQFYKNMFCDERVYDVFMENAPMRDAQGQKDELASIKDQFLSSNCVEIKCFDKVIIGEKDKIIPFKNQIEFWKSKGIKPVIIDAPHYVFDKYDSWDELAE